MTHPFTRAYVCRWQIKLPGICIFSMGANYNNSTCIMTSQCVREIHPQPKLQFCLIYKSGTGSSSAAALSTPINELYVYLKGFLVPVLILRPSSSQYIIIPDQVHHSIFTWCYETSSISAAADYPEILDADWSIQILHIAYLGQAMLDNPLIC